MTRAEFLLAYGDIADPMRPDSKFARDLDALLAAARAEALEDAAQTIEDDGIAMPEGDIQAALARQCRRLRSMSRALVQPRSPSGRARAS